jgi:hypothetical protein
MGKLLNSPKVVVPLALASLGFITYQIAPSVFQGWPLAIFQGDARQQKVLPPGPIHKVSEHTEASYVALLIRERWVPERWRQFATIGIDPFLTSRDPIETIIEILEDEEEAQLVVVVDPEMLESYIVENLGLDENGLFVRFGRVRKREGDMLRMTDGRDLVLGSIALAEERRTEADHAMSIAAHLSRMQLQAVILNAPAEALTTTPPVSSEAVKVPRGFREGDSVNADAVNRLENSESSASAVISGGQQKSGIYQLGDFVQKNPALGLAEVHDDYVQLVDRYGQFYRLDL